MSLASQRRLCRFRDAVIQQPSDFAKHPIRRQIAHAAVMLQGASAFAATLTIEVEVKV